ncbi:MAG: DUF2807 domain-containing protein [Dehalococcoidales bacterium]|jgi:hypothetical protein|nr:DUF2807 domain-containing protein [Dehalococcoidales bacterium]
MKKILCLFISGVVTAATICLYGCGGGITGSGELITETYEFTGFSFIEAERGFRLTVEESPSFSVSITCDDNVQQYLDIKQSDDTLYLGFKKNGTATLRATITMPALEGLNLSQGSSAEISGFSSSDDFSVTMTEGSILSGTIIAGDIGFGLSGGSSVTLTGSGRNLVARSSDGSKLMLEQFMINDADINIDGGGQAILTISGKLDTTLTGGSSLHYIGEPVMGEVNVSGGSVLAEK